MNSNLNDTARGIVTFVVLARVFPGIAEFLKPVKPVRELVYIISRMPADDYAKLLGTLLGKMK
ncbi:MAG: hypothetical protein DRI26_06630 [Chloroflexi bacterium]|nr:MAG: hypothetical protein DRI26_06630 [Chloroflexota bacterium]